eukprot:GHVN01104438.1.p1 GENE.GHVN01104438.1~~GHVN01104438.1.p1  ORF type:complete len:259 (+),score=62.80 GHVN01104438.1:146-922(+)
METVVVDSDERAIVFIGGCMPSKAGEIRKGVKVSDVVTDMMMRNVIHRSNEVNGDKKKENKYLNTDDYGSIPVPRRVLSAQRRWSHPSFSRVVIALVEECLTKRMFNILREERHLTYDASFNVMGVDVLPLGFFIATVHTNKQDSHNTASAAKSVLTSLVDGTRPLYEYQLTNAKNNILNHHENDLLGSSRYWLDLVNGVQLPQMPSKTIGFISSFKSLVESVTLDDVNTLLHLMGLDKQERVWENIAYTIPARTEVD